MIGVLRTLTRQLDARHSLLCLSKEISRLNDKGEREPVIKVELNFDKLNTRKNTAYFHMRLELRCVDNYLTIKRMYHRRLQASAEYV